MYFTKVQTIETFKEIYNDDLKELHGQKKIKDSLFKSHVQSLIEAKLLNPNYGHSYYIDTILESSGGLCLNSTPYESLDTEKMECVRAFIEGFLITNKSKRFKVIDKKSHVITIDNMTSMYHSKPKN